jgi:16S rRNA (cytidine1402-2'-O)-methyltransferase
MAATLGGAREAAVARELTKLYEEVRRASLSDLAAHYEEVGGPKGEVVVVVGPPGEAPAPTADDINEQLRRSLETHSARDAAALVSAATGLPKREIYARAIALSRGGD